MNFESIMEIFYKIQSQTFAMNTELADTGLLENEQISLFESLSVEMNFINFISRTFEHRNIAGSK